MYVNIAYPTYCGYGKKKKRKKIPHWGFRRFKMGLFFTIISHNIVGFAYFKDLNIQGRNNMGMLTAFQKG